MIQAIILSLIGIASLTGIWAGFDAKQDAQKFGANQKISELTALTSVDGLDLLPIVDTSAGQTKSLSWNVATATIKTIHDLIYSPIFSTSAGLASLLSDETGSGGGFVRATGPTISGAQLTASPALTTPSFDVAGTDATGDIYYNGGSGVLTRLPVGSSNEFLRVSGGLPDWDNTALITNPMTATATFTSVNDSATTLGANLYFNALASTTITGATLPKPVFLATSTNSLVLSSTNSTTTDFLGFAILDTNNGATNTVQIEGIVPGFSGLTRGAPYWVNATGTISTTPTAGGAMVGYAISSTEILIDKDDRSWTYLGSATYIQGSANGVSCDATVGVPLYARNIVSSVSVSGAGGGAPSSAQGTIVNTRRGGAMSFGGTFGSPSTRAGGSVSISGNTLTLNGDFTNGGSNGSCSGTAYFYR